MLFFLQTVIRCEIIFYYWTCLPSYLLNLHIDFDHFGGTLDEFALLFLPVDFQKKSSMELWIKESWQLKQHWALKEPLRIAYNEMSKVSHIYRVISNIYRLWIT